jgi:oxygen-independent coproporphyrinogen III oxidase
MVESNAKPVSSLYVHVPFCAQKCSYCAFYSEPSTGELINRYVHALIRELELVAPDLKPATVFFGGGTPSLLNLKQWETVLQAMERLQLTGAEEWTVECNPAAVSLEKARLLRSYGVNRVSMGVQSLNEDLLDRLGRVHTRQMAFKSFDVLRQAGFDNLNLDLMFAIPGQSLATWRETLSEVAAMGSEHVSSYEVIYEDDTPLYAQLQAGEFAVDEDLACEMYEELVESATRAGLEQYEVANFARQSRLPACPASELRTADILSAVPQALSRHRTERSLTRETHRERLDSVPPSPEGEPPAFACRHNVNYWRGGSFYGTGPSATSYVSGVRTQNWSNTQLYCEQLEAGRRAIQSREELPALARAGETAAFGLRLVSGWPFEHFRQTTGYDLRTEWARDMAELAGRGWGEMDRTRFHLTPEGLRFADAAAQLFLR